LFMDYLDDFVSIYLDDILIFSKDKKEHQSQVKKVLDRLRKAGLEVDIRKSEFSVTRTRYLGLIVTPEGVEVDPEKIESIITWQRPRNLREARGFLGFCNYYRRFIRGFAKVAKPMTRLTEKDHPFQWTSETEESFTALKGLLTSAPILNHFDPEKVAVVETDASDWALGGVLSQRDEQGVLRPVAFFSKNLAPAECNYDIYDKEMLAIIRALEQWRPELEGLKDPVQILSDHKSLEYFMTTKKLSRRQARWAEFLSAFKFKIVYRKGKANDLADALSRRPNEIPQDADDERIKGMERTLLPADRIEFQLCPIEQAEELPPPLAGPTEQEDPTLPERVAAANRQDPKLEVIRQGLTEGQQSRYLGYATQDGLLFFKNRLCVPRTDLYLITRVIREIHDQPAVGHRGIDGTIGLILRGYHWNGLRQDVRRYVSNCTTCKRNKPYQGKYQGLLKPLPIPIRPWKDISCDFISGLPKCDDFDAILVVVDRFSKMKHFIPCWKETDAKMMAQLFFANVWRYHGLPDTIVSDRGPQFVSEFWTELCRILQIKRKLSTAYHPQTDGQTENANKGLLAWLRKYTNFYQDNWVEMLPSAEFAENGYDSETTKLSPFFINYGFHPRMSFDPALNPNPATSRPEQAKREEAQMTAKQMEETWKYVIQEIGKAQQVQKTAADKSRCDASYEIGDLAYISAQNIRGSERPKRKLDQLWYGPYEVLEKQGHSYKLKTPTSWKIHDVFHPSMLMKHPNNPLPGQAFDEQGPVYVDDSGDEHYEVEKVVAARRYKNGTTKYKLKWKGWDQDDNWYPADSCADAPNLLKEFHDKCLDSRPYKKPPPQLAQWLLDKENLDRVQSEDDADGSTELAILGKGVMSRIRS
jgi:hypothetical protein